MFHPEITSFVTARGPLWAVYATNPNWGPWMQYAHTAEAADLAADRLRGQQYTQVTVIPPEGSTNLTPLRIEYQTARDVIDDVTRRMRAATVAAIRAGRSVAEVSAASGIPERTLATWNALDTTPDRLDKQ